MCYHVTQRAAMGAAGALIQAAPPGFFKLTSSWLHTIDGLTVVSPAVTVCSTSGCAVSRELTLLF